jgi:maltose alpha-D-glucosyltransferase/alpha-amylase
MLDRDYPDHAMIAEGGSPRVAVGLGGFHVDFCLPWRMPAYNSLFRKNVTNEGGSTVGVDSYGFSVFDGQGHGNIREFMDEFERHYAAVREVGFIAIPEGNHDLHPRLSFNRTPGEALQALLFTFTMPGVPFLYYGDEIGMRTLMGLPSKEGSYDRSGIRTPMQWDGSPNAGFSTAAPERLYLPVDPAPDRPTVTEQERDPGSMLNRTRALIALKRAHPALRADAAWRPLYAARGEMPIVYERSCEGARVIVAINPTLRPASVALALEGVSGCPRALWGAPDVFVQEGERWRVSLPPASGGVYEVASAPIFTNS